MHSSLNLNTETGRLSARRPNLQNQPALEKDRYLIRDAFTAAPMKEGAAIDFAALDRPVAPQHHAAYVRWLRGLEQKPAPSKPLTLLVADYGQLELRLLAHISKCKSMIDAFTEGGDFHSRTAMGMYPEIREAMERGEALLEWDSKNDGPPPVPLLKDAFTAHRRNAKTLNFSIA